MSKVIKDSPRVESEEYDVIEKMEEEWPEMTKEFKKIQREQYELFLHKQHDYGPGNISVGTQLQTPEEIKLSLTGLWFRMNDMGKPAPGQRENLPETFTATNGAQYLIENIHSLRSSR